MEHVLNGILDWASIEGYIFNIYIFIYEREELVTSACTSPLQGKLEKACRYCLSTAHCIC